MADIAYEIIPITIEEELKQSYLDYAMSVIIGRALPDVRDGLKPVHRRVLYAMSELGNDWNKPHKKSARIVGDVIGKYHPHGDSPVYDSIVRMAQHFAMRYLLIDGQGNFGSVDGDSPAAMRYTEIRLSRFAHALMVDLEKEAVDFVPNYDETETTPDVFPTRVPNLLVNGASGIAVGMATNIPPHNLSEIIHATLALIDHSNISLDALIDLVPGPDFPTAAMINGRQGIIDAYRTGRGRIYIRAKTHIEEDDAGRALIVATELPYQVNKARLLEKIGELVRNKRMDGISGLRDETDKSGMRMVIEVRRDDNPEVVLNNLFSHTQLQVAFGINMVALDNGQPRLLNLKQLLSAFLQHRREVVTRRTIYELRKARERAHILEGLGVALFNIDAIITLIKQAKTPSAAKEALLSRMWQAGDMALLSTQVNHHYLGPAAFSSQYGLKPEGYHLSPTQAQAILELRLHRLTALEVGKIEEEYRALIELSNQLIAILSDPDELHRVIREELLALEEEFSDVRRTKIMDVQQNLSDEDLITEENMVVTLSSEGYLKAQSLSSYQAQHRGGRGKSATKVREHDFVKNILIANTHDTILCFSTQGKVYWLKVHQAPQGGRSSRGRPILNLLPLIEGESISAILPITEYYDHHFVFMVTAQGSTKKVPLSEFVHPRTNGKIALALHENDTLIGVALTDGQQEVMLMTNTGKAIRFHEKAIRPMGRLARGVRGITLRAHQHVISLIIIKVGTQILTATRAGYGQRTHVDDYRSTARGGQGVISIRVNERNGDVVAAAQVTEHDEVLLISDQGTLVRMPVHEISQMGRNTQGVRLIQLSEGECLVGLETIIEAWVEDK